ncbi:delta-1-pyrroline-5-carboxylate dehydrogenase [Mycena haematopus]|nr:delta-1-pyrroline-5-carboxylate dehydrogenase [Mycena haematopus]
MASAQLAIFSVPAVENEPMQTYAPGSPQRAALQAAISQMQADLPFEVPCVINGKPVCENRQIGFPPMPHDHAKNLCTYHEADAAIVSQAIDGALAAKYDWESMPWNDRAAIFLKAADLVSGKYRYKLLAATILGQGKNVWQAEIDAAAELADFLRFGVKFVQDLYAQQPSRNSAGAWNRVEYRALEGFVLAISPFNFTAIGGNLNATPALVGNVVIWKPSPMATYSSYIVHQIFLEAGVPPSVIQFVPGQPEIVAQQSLKHPMFAALNFTGSTFVFKQLWKDIASNMDVYKGYPKIVGETGGKNFHLVHKSAEIRNAVVQAIRAAFEYQGQKCSALSRLYDTLLAEIAKIKVGGPDDWSNYMGPVIGRPAFEKILAYIEKAKQAGGEILAGGTGDDSKGYFVQPTVILTKDPNSVTMVEEIFGPVLTVFVYQDSEYDQILKLVDSTSQYASRGHQNVYYNEKCTGAVVGQQPFGGGRASGTNDKAGSISIFYRFVSPRSIKENFVSVEDYIYPSNLV